MNNDNRLNKKPRVNRRRALKAGLVSGSAATIVAQSGTFKWIRPVVSSTLLPAHAVATTLPEPEDDTLCLGDCTSGRLSARGATITATEIRTEISLRDITATLCEPIEGISVTLTTSTSVTDPAVISHSSVVRGGENIIFTDTDGVAAFPEVDVDFVTDREFGGAINLDLTFTADGATCMQSVPFIEPPFPAE